jgi:hypothetical protein
MVYKPGRIFLRMGWPFAASAYAKQESAAALSGQLGKN